MNIDDVLHLLEPLTPAVLPVVVFVWYRTRQELRAIRRELVELRESPALPDPRLDDLLAGMEALRAEVARLAERDVALQPAVRRALPAAE